MPVVPLTYESMTGSTAPPSARSSWKRSATIGTTLRNAVGEAGSRRTVACAQTGRLATNVRQIRHFRGLVVEDWTNQSAAPVSFKWKHAHAQGEERIER